MKKSLLSLAVAIVAIAGASTQASAQTAPADVQAVDLGLPSGIRWASCNVGATAPEEYGNHYAWGETEPKDAYSWENYKHANGAYNKLTKYCNRGGYGDNDFIDNKTTLEPEDDAATVNWGNAWRMPTDAEWTELREQCTWTQTTQSGVNGHLVTSKTNSNSIFLPATGWRNGTDHYLAGYYGYYWSSSLYADNYPNCALRIYTNIDGAYRDYGDRTYGLSVRPVQEKQTGTGIGDTAAESVTIYAENGRVYCEQDFRIFDLLGRDVTKMNGSLNGVYVVKCGETAQKIAVR